LNAASVIGARFGAELLAALGIDAVVDELLSAELIDQVRFTPGAEYAFRHPLIRAVAYESQLSVDREQTHRTLAAAIEARDRSAADENAALIATHLEAAGELAESCRWYLRAAEWLRPRDLPAARAQWETARRIADELPDDHDDVIAMRIAPRTMLISTALYIGSDADIDERYREFRDLAMQSGDLRSLAIGTAGRVMSLTLNDNRVPEAASLAAELEAMVSRVDCDAATTSIILISVAFAWFTNCEFDAALRVIDTILTLPQGEPTMELAVANSVRGYIEICRGECEQGRQRLRQGIEQARALHPVNYAIVLVYRATLVVLGMYEPDELVVELRDALRRADSFGDICGIITAQCAYGSVLLRAENALHDEAIDVLHRAHANIQKHKVFSLVVAITDVDLAVDAARRGRRDEAIDDLRTSFLLHTSGGFRVFAGCAGEALVELLIERGSIDDLTEAHQIVAEGQTRRPGIPALDLWWLKSRALLAKVEGESDGYAELATQYLELCEKLDARGRLDEARQMVNRIV
jgi:adenylate cyclase